MIGNDVIDLRLSRQESNWQRKGFLHKIFTEEEQLLINHLFDPEIMVWLLWSMKEAAYKIYNRQTKIRAFIPKELVCTIDQMTDVYATGQVLCFCTIYYTKTMITPDSIHTVAVTLLQDLDKIVEVERKNIIKDQNGIPSIVSAELNSNQAVSISNHGRFEKVVTTGIL